MSQRDQALFAAQQHLAANRPHDAANALAALADRPDADIEVLGTYADAILRLGRPAGAILQRLAAIGPDHPGVWRLILRDALSRKSSDEAERAAEHLARTSPDDPDSWRGLSWLYRQHAKFTLSNQACRRALELVPTDTGMLQRLAINTLSMGRAEEAAAMLRTACAAHPTNSGLAKALASTLNAVADAPPAEILDAHRRFGALLSPACTLPAAPRRAPAPVRLAVISPDLHRHSVAFFIEALFRHHARTGLDIHAYDTLGLRDETSQRLQSLLPPGRWHAALDKRPGSLAAQLRADAIDVAVELSGLTMDDRLAELAARPVPLIVSYLGYPNTTGVPAIDARFVDSATDPPGQTLSTERLVRLDPCFLCFTPGPLPDLRRNGPPGPTFACFNALKKLTDATLRLFAGVLRAAPDSRLLLKCRGLEEPTVAADLLGRMVALGIDPAHVELRGFVSDDAGHLALYSHADVALDTYPYAGTTTTCEALSMGVPVVSLAGRTHASRVGWSILRAIGRESWCAPSADAYPQLAADVLRAARSTNLRPPTRAALLNSPVCDAPTFATRFGNAVRAAWTTKA